MDQFIASYNSVLAGVIVDAQCTLRTAQRFRNRSATTAIMGAIDLPLTCIRGLSGRLITTIPQGSALQRYPNAGGAQAGGQAASARVARHLVHLSLLIVTLPIPR